MGDIWKPKECGPHVTGLSELMEEHFTLQLWEPSVNLAMKVQFHIWKTDKSKRKTLSRGKKDYAKVLKIIT